MERYSCRCIKKLFSKFTIRLNAKQPGNNLAMDKANLMYSAPFFFSFFYKINGTFPAIIKKWSGPKEIYPLSKNIDEI